MLKFIARQPILDGQLELAAYELLFRHGPEEFFRGPDSGDASASLIVDSSLLFDLRKLTAGRPAFLNFTEETLLREYALLLPRDEIIVEILESVEPGAVVLDACRKLKSLGYRLALDDYIGSPVHAPFLELVEIVKVDLLNTPGSQRRIVAETLLSRGIRTLAEKVETREDFEEAKRLGYTYFQGYFFARPEIMSAHDVPAFKPHYLKILALLSHPLDFDEIDRLIESEPSLCYKFLRYLNSPLFAFRGEIRSIRHALALIGENDFRRWFSMMAVVSMAKGKPEELIVSAVFRAQFCELLAGQARLEDRKMDLYLMGLLSLLDAILDRPLHDILDEIPLPADIGEALLGADSPFKKLLDCVTSYERGDWGNCSRRANELRMDEDALPGFYLQAMEGARQIFAIE